MILGVDYYPEQWPDALLGGDLDRICALGATTIRIGEFAWHLMEPARGAYTFAYFDRVIAAAKARDLTVIFGTPTATPPAWLAAECDIASRFADATPRAFGGRHTACPNQQDYRAACESIVRALVSHYRDEEAIIAWQIDNEFGHEGADTCFCDSCTRAFRAWLTERYDGDITALNARWGTVFWSQQYNAFDEIPLPAPTITTHNPSLRLEWLRFRSHTLCSFAADQARWVREECPTATLMHDFPGGGLAKAVDYAALARPLDVVGYNNYPVWGGQREPVPPAQIAFGLDYMRGIKHDAPLWITEAIMGAQGHDVTGFLPRPGQAALWSIQALARGATGLCYFRYRQATKGAEQYCYGIIDADDREGRRFDEVRSVFTFGRQHPRLGADLAAHVAIVADYDSRAAWTIQRQSQVLDVADEMARWHSGFFDRNVLVDIVDATCDISAYRVVIVPHMIITKPEVTDRLEAFARDGGIVVVTFRSFAKDTDNNLVFGETLPLASQRWLGVEVAETESVQSRTEFALAAQTTPHGWPASARGGVFRDMVRASDDTEVLYTYDDRFFPGYAALTRRSVGRGWAYYVGCALDETLSAALVDTLISDARLRAYDTPDGVEYIPLCSGGILLNHRDSAVEVTTPAGELLTLEAYGYRLVETP